MCRVWRVERYDLWAERRSASGDRGRCNRVIQVRHSKFVNVPRLECDVPVIVELVIVGAADPIQVIVAPHTVVDRIGDKVDVVPSAIAGPTQAYHGRWLRARISQHRGFRIRWIWIRIGNTRTDVPRHRFRSDASDFARY